MKRYTTTNDGDLEENASGEVYLASDVQQLARECLPQIEARTLGLKECWPAPVISDQISKCEALLVKLRQLAEGTL